MAKRGGLTGLAYKVISAVIGLVVALAIVPTLAISVKAITSDTTNFTAAEIALYSLLGLLVAAGIAMYTWREFMARAG